MLRIQEIRKRKGMLVIRVGNTTQVSYPTGTNVLTQVKRPRNNQQKLNDCCCCKKRKSKKRKINFTKYY